jgi:hypothetical protein
MIIGVKLDLESELARENIRPRYLYDLGKDRFGDFETDAHLFVADESPSAPRFSAVNVLKVVHHGKELMSAKPNVHPLQPDGSADKVAFSKWRVYESLTSGKPE